MNFSSNQYDTEINFSNNASIPRNYQISIMNQLEEENIEDAYFLKVICFQKEKRILEKIEGKRRSNSRSKGRRSKKEDLDTSLPGDKNKLVVISNQETDFY